MKKKVLSLLQLAMISGVLVSCSGNKEQVLSFSRPFEKGHALKSQFLSTSSNVYIDENGELIKINDPEDPEVNKLKSLSISHSKLNLFFSNRSGKEFYETHQLSVLGNPRKATIGTITWTSSDESVASVDETGLVTARGQGIAVITATSQAGIKTESRVIVNNTNAPLSSLTKAATRIAQTQESEDFEPVDKIHVVEDYVATKTCEGEVLSRTKFDQRFWISLSDTYFRISSNDEEVKTQGGSVVPSNSGYVFYTTPDYFSYVFCTSNNKSTYMSLDQSFLVDQGKTAYYGLVEVLQSFFVAGSKIMTNQIEDALSSDDLKTTAFTKADYIGSLGETSGQFAYQKTSSRSGTVSLEDEDDMEIPAGTMVSITDVERFVWEDNVLSTKHINEKLDYVVNGKSYCQEFDIHYYYQSRGVELWWPEASNFTQVDSIFDL